MTNTDLSRSHKHFVYEALPRYILSMFPCIVDRFLYRYNIITTFLQVWTSLPVVMLVVAVFLVLLPLLDKPVPTLTAFAVISLGAPVYLCFVMTTPWKIRPSVLDRWSGKMTLLLGVRGSISFVAEIV